MTEQSYFDMSTYLIIGLIVALLLGLLLLRGKNKGRK
jgi:LPXTG-motif cell wall-anchored protein